MNVGSIAFRGCVSLNTTPHATRVAHREKHAFRVRVPRPLPIGAPLADFAPWFIFPSPFFFVLTDFPSQRCSTTARYDPNGTGEHRGRGPRQFGRYVPNLSEGGDQPPPLSAPRLGGEVSRRRGLYPKHVHGRVCAPKTAAQRSFRRFATDTKTSHRSAHPTAGELRAVLRTLWSGEYAAFPVRACPFCFVKQRQGTRRARPDGTRGAPIDRSMLFLSNRRLRLFRERMFFVLFFSAPAFAVVAAVTHTLVTHTLILVPWPPSRHHNKP